MSHCLECELVTHFFFPKPFFCNLIEFPTKKTIQNSIFLANAIEFLQIKTPSLNPMN
jgi:hypothetical protein